MLLMSNSFFNIIYIINLVFIYILTIVYFNQAFHMIFSIFVPSKKYKDTNEEKKYGFIIAARNEENNIGNIIDSIKNQNYNQDLIHIFVVADNCSDNTAKVALDKGAIVIERIDDMNFGKSYALEYAFNVIFKEYNDLNIDAFMIFDADNILDVDFTKEMNKAFISGNEMITGLRLPKNFGDSWLAGASSYMFLRECRQIHHDRSLLNIGTYVSGTGYLISSNIIKDLNYWPFHTLTEDIEISAYMASHNKKIAYCEKAKFYDCQPDTLKKFWIQRLRWCRGTHQVFFKHSFKLFTSFFKKQPLTAWGMFVHTIPLPAISFIWFIAYAIIGFVYYLITKVPYDVYASECMWISLQNLVYPIFLGFIIGVILMIETWKLIDAKWYKKMSYTVLFPFAMYLFLPITLVALFKKVKWNPTNNIK